MWMKNVFFFSYDVLFGSTVGPRKKITISCQKSHYIVIVVHVKTQLVSSTVTPNENTVSMVR